MLIIAPSWYKSTINLYIDYYNEKLSYYTKSNNLLTKLNNGTLLKSNHTLDWIQLYLFSYTIKADDSSFSTIITTLCTSIKNVSKSDINYIRRYIDALDDGLLDYYSNKSSIKAPNLEDLPLKNYKTTISNATLKEAEDYLAHELIVLHSETKMEGKLSKLINKLTELTRINKNAYGNEKIFITRTDFFLFICGSTCGCKLFYISDKHKKKSPPRICQNARHFTLYEIRK